MEVTLASGDPVRSSIFKILKTKFMVSCLNGFNGMSSQVVLGDDIKISFLLHFNKMSRRQKNFKT